MISAFLFGLWIGGVIASSIILIDEDQLTPFECLLLLLWPVIMPLVVRSWFTGSRYSSPPPSTQGWYDDNDKFRSLLR